MKAQYDFASGKRGPVLKTQAGKTRITIRIDDDVLQWFRKQVTTKGLKVAALFVLFQKRVCGPLANTLFHHRPTNTALPPAKIEAAYHKADVAIQNVIDLLAA